MRRRLAPANSLQQCSWQRHLLQDQAVFATAAQVSEISATNLCMAAQPVLLL
jgi:hypothetical protein